MAKAIIDIETTGLNPMEHRIVAIGVKLGDRDIILMDESEYYLLVNFWDTVEKEGIEKIIGFNIDFDWQFLKLRSLYHRLKIKHFRKYQGRVDLRQILNGSGGQYRKGTKLVDYCRFLGIDVPEDDANGSEIPELWEKFEEEGDEEAKRKICEHLKRDLERTWELYKILVDCGLIEE
ncbi:hypothetical protein MJ_0365 [Methanocaldococcus jannaschii DSM 2661]|uniref:Uncharacterized protein MJ0365 n=1 Tax=Methanocaldococcus jannaschii (strain ATCC 43067 / DSM 2661 / JAL-1 / JCM 10045 / NBRC 100440) TaxID=243232 RepID=Y365_METJA|nr:ribonuclease H-like domain-containing protein [Methanocaldococcus jannaschii]Q57811.1 RecName: Full=Uncharacterized protein MJ0365 [Methanocaldococcus jannaschii DSM 2661]AAB98356.1 hypothetical protein MJ_0365 [Methanocaldococcus jannaschii DSM 2661]